MSKINTLEDAFKAIGLDANVRPDVSMLPEAFQKSIIADFEAEVLTKALNNEGQEKEWIADYSNSDQIKYEHVYYHTASGWALRDVIDWFTSTACGSRRVFRTEAIAEDAWNRFKEIYIRTL